MPISHFSKNGLTTGFLRFESFLPDTFWCSLQSKEHQKVHQHFCPENRKIGLRNSCVAALKTVFKLIKPEKPRKTPKGRKKAQKVVVDFLDFFFGRSDWIRTSDALPSRIVERGSRHSRVSRSPCFVGYRFVKTAHRAVFARSPLVPCSGPIRRGFEPGASGKRERRANALRSLLVGVTGFDGLPMEPYQRAPPSIQKGRLFRMAGRKSFAASGKTPLVRTGATGKKRFQQI